MKEIMFDEAAVEFGIEIFETAHKMASERGANWDATVTAMYSALLNAIISYSVHYPDRCAGIPTLIAKNLQYCERQIAATLAKSDEQIAAELAADGLLSDDLTATSPTAGEC